MPGEPLDAPDDLQKESRCQVALGQLEPEGPGVPNEAATGLEQPLLEAREGPALDGERQDQPALQSMTHQCIGVGSMETKRYCLKIATWTVVREPWQPSPRKLDSPEAVVELARRYVDVLNRYPVFSQTSIHAHFVALLVALYRVYETRRDTINLAQLLRLLRDSGKIDAAKLEEAKRECEDAKQLWVKVAILRNEAFGHQRNDTNIEEVFRKAGVKPLEVKELVDRTQHIVNKLSRALVKDHVRVQPDSDP